MKRSKIYSTITIKKELYTRLKNYSEKNGYAITKLISLMIENKISDKVK